MLSTLFLICAVVGGSLVLAQLLLSVLAFGAGRGLRLHHRIGGSAGSPRGGMHRGGVGVHGGARGGMFRGLHHHSTSVRSAGMHAGASHDVRTAGGVKQSIKTGTAPKAAIKTAAKAANGAVSAHYAGHYWGHWAMAWVMGMLNFQGVVSGLTVFGLIGLAANAAKRPASAALELGIAGAFVMMALISGMLSVMTGLEKDGTIDLHQAIGKLATVYLSVPERNQGQGKVTVSLQQRSMEFPAVTFQDDLLATGQKVVIVGVLEPAVMLVIAADKYVPDQGSPIME